MSQPWSKVAAASARRRILRIPAVCLVTVLLAVAAAVVVAPAPASAAVPGLVYVTASTGADSVVYKSVRVFCPAGTQVIGGGYELVGAEGSVVLDDFIPSTNSLLVGAGEVVGPGEPADGTTAAWQVRATAVCASPLPGYAIVSGSSQFAPGNTQGIGATCPVGRVAIGAGASLSNGFGQVAITSLLIFSTSASAAARQDEDGYSGSWSITAYTICANPLPGLGSVTSPSGTGSSSLRTAGAFCPAGRQPIGTGWISSQGNAAGWQILNIHLSLSGGGSSPGVTALATEDASGYGGNWSVTVQAICADG